MKVNYNDTFSDLLAEYNLPGDLSFTCPIPADISKMLNSPIIETELGITIGAGNKLRICREPWETRSSIEYDENHFHVDSFAGSEQEAFKLGIKTLLLLAEKFVAAAIPGIRLLFSFQPPSLALQEAIYRNSHTSTDEYFISDHLTFYRKRYGEEPVANDTFSNKYYALLTIDI